MGSYELFTTFDRSDNLVCEIQVLDSTIRDSTTLNVKLSKGNRNIIHPFSLMMYSISYTIVPIGYNVCSTPWSMIIRDVCVN